MLHRRPVRILSLVAALLVLPLTSFAGIESADLAIAKTDGAANSTPGTGVIYTITATNAGPDDVTGATVADTFPATLTCNWTCVASAGSSCTAAGAGDINDAVNLLNGGTATYTATCTIDSSATGSLANTATISSATSDPNMADNSATDTNTLTPSADLSMAGVATPNPVAPGASFTIDATITNAGPSDATGVVVTTTLPGFVTFVSTTGCAEDPNGNPTCSVGTVPAGQTAMFSLVATADSANTGTVDMSVASSVSDPNSGDNTIVVTVTAAAAAGGAIPTLSGFGMIVMVLLLLGAGIVALRR